MPSSKKIATLIYLLEKSVEILSSFPVGYSNNFSSSKQFHNSLINEINSLKNKDYSNDTIHNLYKWFTPLCDWCDYTKAEREDLRIQIFSTLTSITQEFR